MAHLIALIKNARRLRILQDPLLHFLILGALVFAVDQVLFTSRGDAETIIVKGDVQTELGDLFRVRNKREASAEDMKALIKGWVESEALYRVGIEQGLDRGDRKIRDLIIGDAIGVIQSGLTVPPVTTDALRTWFEARRASYEKQGLSESFETLSDKIRRDWTDETQAALLAAAIRDAAAKFNVVVEKPVE